MKRYATNKLFYTLLILISLLGCQKTYQKQPVLDQISNDIHTSIHQNSQIANNRAQKVPASINDALMPKLNYTHQGAVKAHEKQFDLSVHNIPARTFFMGLVKDTKHSMVVSPNVSGTISLNLKKVTIEQALAAVRDAYGYEYQKTSYGFMILPVHLETRIFTVNYLNVNRQGVTNTKINSGQITNKVGVDGQSVSQDDPASSVKTTTKADFWNDLKLTIETMIGNSDGRSVIVSPQSGIVIVKAFPNELREVAQFLDNSQHTLNRQVILETKILEVELSNAYKTGIDWRLFGARQGFTQNSIAGQSFGNIFTMKLTGGNPFQLAVKLLETQGNVQVLSSPRVSTLNNQKAVIKVGTDEFYVTNVSNTTSTGTSSTDTTQDIELTPFFSGIALDVTPQIDSSGEITLHIHPSISTVSDDSKSFTVGGKAQELPLAKSKIRESDSIVRALNGQVIIIGGLMENKVDNTQNSTPFLSHVPVLGNLFDNHNNTTTKTELVILLRPIVIESGSWNSELKSSAKAMQGLKNYQTARNRPYKFKH